MICGTRDSRTSNSSYAGRPNDQVRLHGRGRIAKLFAIFSTTASKTGFCDASYSMWKKTSLSEANSCSRRNRCEKQTAAIGLPSILVKGSRSGW